MAFGNPYANYANTKIQTATPAQLTLMLYDGAIKFCNLAINAVENKKIEAANTNNIYATRNFKYPVAKEFDKVYEYLAKRLVEANLHKDKEILEEVNTHLRTMRDTWVEVMRRGK